MRNRMDLIGYCGVKIPRAASFRLGLPRKKCNVTERRRGVQAISQKSSMPIFAQRVHSGPIMWNIIP